MQNNSNNEGQKPLDGKRTLSSSLAALFGWLVCAGLCLACAIQLENFPQGYDVFLPAIILVLFCNIFVFLFISSRWAKFPKKLWASVIRVCAGEALFLIGIWAISKYAFG